MERGLQLPKPDDLAFARESTSGQVLLCRKKVLKERAEERSSDEHAFVALVVVFAKRGPKKAA